MKRRFSVFSYFYILLFTGCAIFEPAEEFDPNELPASAAGGTQTVEIPISRSSDDAEERSTGFVSLTNTQLELTTYKGGAQIIGLRFKLDIPNDATVNDAFIQFTSNNKDSKTANLVLYGDASSNPSTFVGDARSLQASTLPLPYVLEPKLSLPQEAVEMKYAHLRVKYRGYRPLPNQNLLSSLLSHHTNKEQVCYKPLCS